MHSHKQNIWAVALGAFVGFSFTSLVAVMGSRVITQIISVKKSEFYTLEYF